VRKDPNPTKMSAALERPSASCKRHSLSCEERTLDSGNEIMLKLVTFYWGSRTTLPVEEGRGTKHGHGKILDGVP
jgi:hypothetical protein